MLLLLICNRSFVIFECTMWCYFDLFEIQIPYINIYINFVNFSLWSFCCVALIYLKIHSTHKVFKKKMYTNPFVLNRLRLCGFVFYRNILFKTGNKPWNHKKVRPKALVSYIAIPSLIRKLILNEWHKNRLLITKRIRKSHYEKQCFFILYLPIFTHFLKSRSLWGIFFLHDDPFSAAHVGFNC